MAMTIKTNTPRRNIIRPGFNEALVRQARVIARIVKTQHRDSREILELALRLDALEAAVSKLKPRRRWWRRWF